MVVVDIEPVHLSSCVFLINSKEQFLSQHEMFSCKGVGGGGNGEHTEVAGQTSECSTLDRENDDVKFLASV